jgi:hypothetical protein
LKTGKPGKSYPAESGKVFHNLPVLVKGLPIGSLKVMAAYSFTLG